MNIFYSDYYITFIILSILFLQYQALENNARSKDITSLDLMQNVLSSKNFVNRDSLVHSTSENKHLKKQQDDKKGRNNKKKIILKKRNKKRVQAKKPLARISPVRKTPAPRPPKGRLPTRKPGSRPSPPKRTTKKQTTSKKPSPGGPNKPKPPVKPTPKPPVKPTSKPSVRPTSKPPVKPTSKPSVKPTPQPPVKPAPKPSVRPTSKPPVNPPAKPQTIKPTTTTTAKPHTYAALITKTISDINALRRKHQASALNFNQSLAERAKKIADESHKKLNDIGDNSVGLIFYHARSEREFDPVSFWTSGTQHIDYNDLNERTVPFEFAQLVWVSSKEIGCGISELNDNAGILTICLLSPKGGIPGRYPENIRGPIQ